MELIVRRYRRRNIFFFKPFATTTSLSLFVSHVYLSFSIYLVPSDVGRTYIIIIYGRTLAQRPDRHSANVSFARALGPQNNGHNRYCYKSLV